jgi:hypothetical protein
MVPLYIRPVLPPVLELAKLADYRDPAKAADYRDPAIEEDSLGITAEGFIRIRQIEDSATIP